LLVPGKPVKPAQEPQKRAGLTAKLTAIRGDVQQHTAMNVDHGRMKSQHLGRDEAGERAEGRAGKRPGRGVELATYYLDLHACPDRPWRIDVVAVQLSKSGKLEEIRIYQHAVTG